jgi:hypothetical protein
MPDELLRSQVRVPDVGEELHIRAVGKATRASVSEDEGRDPRSVDVQITMMNVGAKGNLLGNSA